MLANGGKAIIELDAPTDRACSNCGQVFAGNFMPELQAVCPHCVELAVRYSQAELRQSRTETRRRRLEAMGITGQMLGMTFASYATNEQPDAYEAAKAFVEGFPDVRGLTLAGGVGTGKTHLAVAILQAIAEWGEPGRYVYLPGLLSDLAMASDWQAAAEKLVTPLYTASLLVLDDCGRERAKTDSAWPAMRDTLINRRWEGGYPTVLTTNLTKAALTTWLGEAAASRLLSGMRIVAMRPGDRRFSLPPKAPIPESMRDALIACATCQGSGWVLDGRHRAAHPDRLLKCPTCQGAGY